MAEGGREFQGFLTPEKQKFVISSAARKEKVVIDPRSVDETLLGDYPWSNDDWLAADEPDADVSDEEPKNNQQH